ncbi:DUF3164 family protein [Kaistia sp. MMO-174]|uniref:DUF3164 family protein n=1 Tax=Kaistia sp. MMO-174 TaxID=3081256 RepID=UPI003016B3AF
MSEATTNNPAPTIDVGGKPFMYDAKGNLVPLSAVKPMDLLQDEMVRKVIGYARELSAQIARFKGHTFDDVGSLQALIAQDYGATLGGKKGNVSLTSFDGTQRVTVQVADLLEFGPELQAAKSLVDACLAEWSEGSRDEIRAIVTRAFNVDKEGQINRAELFMLLRVSIEDERWQNAMQAIRDSIRIIGSKTYVRFHERDSADGAWRAITIDLAAA